MSRLLPLDTLVRKLYIHLKNIGYIWFKNKRTDNFGFTRKEHISVEVMFKDAHKENKKIVHDCLCKAIKQHPWRYKSAGGQEAAEVRDYPRRASC